MLSSSILSSDGRVPPPLHFPSPSRSWQIGRQGEEGGEEDQVLDSDAE